MKPSDVIKNKKNWCKGALAFRDDGWCCSPRHEKAEQFCLLGACQRAEYVDDVLIAEKKRVLAG